MGAQVCFGFGDFDVCAMFVPATAQTRAVTAEVVPVGVVMLGGIVQCVLE